MDVEHPTTSARRGVPAGALGVALLVTALAFALLAVFVARRPLPPSLLSDLDHGVRVYPGAWRYDLSSGLRALGSPFVVYAAAVVVAGALWHAPRRLDVAVMAIAAPLLAGVAEVAVRSEIDRPLPPAAALSGAFGYGFPSGHTAGITALALVMLVAVVERSAHRQVTTCAIAAAGALVTAVASSSVVGGAHRSLDVVGGVLLGGAAALAVAVVGRAVAGRRSAVAGCP